VRDITYKEEAREGCPGSCVETYRTSIKPLSHLYITCERADLVLFVISLIEHGKVDDQLAQRLLESARILRLQHSRNEIVEPRRNPHSVY
jgi:hypothetical protein